MPCSRSTPQTNFMFLWMPRLSARRPVGSRIPMSTSQPNCHSAGSMELVAAITKMFNHALIPSISVSNWEMTQHSNSPLVWQHRYYHSVTMESVSTHLFTLLGNWINLANENDCWQVLSFLKCHLPQITPTCHYTYDLQTVDWEERSRLVRDRTHHECLTGTKCPKRRIPCGGLILINLNNCDGHRGKITNMRHLFVIAANVVVSYIG